MTVTILCPRWLAPIAPVNVALNDYAVVISGEKIVAVLPRAEAQTQYPAAEVVELPDHLLTPGFVNAHTHAAMSLLRGAGDDLPLHEWLQTRIWPLESKLVSEEFVFDGTVIAIEEMLLGGTTCFNDMYFFPQATARAAQAMGIRANIGLVIFDFPSAYGTGAADYLAKGLALRDQTQRDETASAKLISFCLAPHAPYTVSDESFGKIAVLANELGLAIHIHLHETAQEITDSLTQYGKRPLQRLVDLGLVGPDFVAIHAVHLNSDDIALMTKNSATVVHCPHSNLKLASGIAPVYAMLEAGLSVAIGTDGSASNNQLNLLSETRTACLLAKGTSGKADAFSAAIALHTMTLGGAKAIGLSDQIGSIEVGKFADLTAIQIANVDHGPIHDAIAHLIYSADRSQVSDVWISGVPVVRKRQLAQTGARATLDEVVPRSRLWHNLASDAII